jgi:regulator of sigma E protease
VRDGPRGTRLSDVVPVIDSLINTAIVLVILVVLVVAHEFGHFVTARWAGVRVHEFGIGFPPRARVLARDKETVYSLNWLPIGGFVRLEGEEGTSDDPRAFVRQPLRIKLLILVAGVAMNFLLALLIFTLIAGLADPSVGVRIAAVQPDSPAAEAGLKGGRSLGVNEQGFEDFDDSGDVILAIDGQRFPYLDDLSAVITGDLRAPLRYLWEHPGKTITITVRHADGSVEDVTATLRPREELSTQKGPLGFIPHAYLPADNVNHSLGETLNLGLRRTVDASVLVLAALRDLVANITQPNVAGPIGIIGAVASARTELPPVFLVWLVGLLSANLAVINILPLPPMDGGRVAVSVAQAVTGNRISVSLERAVYLAGFVFLMIFLVWISYFDIQRQFGGG